MTLFQGGSDNPMPPIERQKLMNLKGTDQEKIKKYVFKRWQDLYFYHEHPDNPDKWGDCFLQRRLLKPTQLLTLIGKSWKTHSEICPCPKILKLTIG